MYKILVVEDDPGVRDLVEQVLRHDGMDTQAVESGEAALERLRTGERLDLVLLDVMLPKMDGVSVCRKIRAGEAGEEMRNLPVVMMTVRDDEMSVVVGLEVGADDYIAKPFRPRELVSRIRAHLRRRHLDTQVGPEEPLRLEFPGLQIDLFKRQVFANGKLVVLTAKEFEVLTLLASHPGWVYSRDQIMRHLWGGDFFGDARAADVHIQHIRKKVEPDPKKPRYVQTVRGMGYRFAEL